MKQFLFTLCTGVISLTAFFHSAYAQFSEKSKSAIETKNFISSVRYLAALEGHAKTDVNMADDKNLNPRAIKDFQFRYKQVVDARWVYITKGGYESYFVRDGYVNRVIYDKKGRWVCSLILYGENGLPRDIRTRVRSIYFDSTIFLVEEVQTTETTVYLVYLEDDSTIRILKVDQDGDVQTSQELPKTTSSQAK